MFFSKLLPVPHLDQCERRKTCFQGGQLPGDIFLRHWSSGKDAALDVTITNSLASSHVAGAAAEAGSALDKAVKKKVDGAAEACRDQGIVFLPLAVESLGGMHRGTVQQVKQLAAALASR